MKQLTLKTYKTLNLSPISEQKKLQNNKPTNLITVDSPKNEQTLTPTQQYVMEQFNLGYNIFITGPAGSGKSHLIRSIVQKAEQQNKRIL